MSLLLTLGQTNTLSFIRMTDGSINTTRDSFSGCTHMRLLEAAAHLHVLCDNLV
jgi:hypothetical protein